MFQLNRMFHCGMLVSPGVTMIQALCDHYCRCRWFQEMLLVLCMHQTVMTLQRQVRGQLVWILWHVGAFHWPLCSHLTDSLIFFRDGWHSKFWTQKVKKNVIMGLLIMFSYFFLFGIIDNRAWSSHYYTACWVIIYWHLMKIIFIELFFQNSDVSLDGNAPNMMASNISAIFDKLNPPLRVHRVSYRSAHNPLVKFFPQNWLLLDIAQLMMQ